jgi:ribonuclease VapC
MVIDTSAVLAMLQNETIAPVIEAALEDDPVRLMAAPSALEAAIVIEARHGEAGGRELDLLLHKAGIELVSFDADQVALARRAYRRFGKGYHEAGLNFGDCFSYALSQRTGEALLYVGDDFGKTDIASVELHIVDARQAVDNDTIDEEASTVANPDGEGEEAGK